MKPKPAKSVPSDTRSLASGDGIRSIAPTKTADTTSSTKQVAYTTAGPSA
jgi:hypothetical protein